MSRPARIWRVSRAVFFFLSLSVLIFGVLAKVAVYTQPARATGSYPELLSLGDSGQLSNGQNRSVTMSNDGRFVAFNSSATNLTSNQSNPLVSNQTSCYSGFVRDRQSDQTTLVTVNSQGQEQNGCSGGGLELSGNGRFVFFTEEDATNLGVDPSYIHPGYGYGYLFRHDLLSGVTDLISLDDSGNPIPPNSFVYVSDDGNYVVYDGILRNIAEATNYEVAGGYITSVSGDGTKITYSAPIGGSGLNNGLYLRDLTSDTDTLVYADPVPNDISAYGWVSKGGTYVFFEAVGYSAVAGEASACSANNIRCVYRFDTETNETLLVVSRENGMIVYPQPFRADDVSADGSKLLFANGYIESGTATASAVFNVDITGLALLNIDSGQSYHVGYGPNWIAPNVPAFTANVDARFAMSADGTQLTFTSKATNFGVPANCTVNTEGTITHEECANPYATTTTQSPNGEGLPPGFTSASTASTGMRAPFSFTVSTTGSPTPSLSESGTLPAGITFTDNGDGTATLAGAAAAGTAGSYPIALAATNGVGSPVTQNFTLTITTAASAPSIISANADTETFGVPFSFTVTTNGYPVPTLTKSGTLPAGVTFTENGDGTATLAGTPTSSAVGAYTLTLKAKNSVATATQSFTLTIVKAPIFRSVTIPVGHVGSAYSLTLKTSAYTTAVLMETGTLPAGLSFSDNGDGTAMIAGTPQVGSGGAYPVTVTATNAQGSSTKTFTIKINEAPAITSPNSASATIGQAFSFTATVTGYPTPSLSKGGSLPKGLSYHSSTRTISGTPAAGSQGSYMLVFTAKNSSGTVQQVFTLTVS